MTTKQEINKINEIAELMNIAIALDKNFVIFHCFDKNNDSIIVSIALGNKPLSVKNNKNMYYRIGYKNEMDYFNRYDGFKNQLNKIMKRGK